MALELGSIHNYSFKFNYHIFINTFGLGGKSLQFASFPLLLPLVLSLPHVIRGKKILVKVAKGSSQDLAPIPSL